MTVNYQSAIMKLLTRQNTYQHNNNTKDSVEEITTVNRKNDNVVSTPQPYFK